MPITPKIFLIHATPLSIAPINDSFRRLWPQANLANLLDDSLSADLQLAGKIDQKMTDRFVALGRYAHQAGADAILFTCSAFGTAIDACKDALPIPVLRPNEAMVEEALARSSRFVLMATFKPAIASISREIQTRATELGRSVSIDPVFVEHAFKAAQDGDIATHDRLIAESSPCTGDAEVICFAQFSMSSAAEACARRSGKRVLTTPDSAVRCLRQRLDASL